MCHFNAYPSEMSKKSNKKIVNDRMNLNPFHFSILQKSHLAVDFTFFDTKDWEWEYLTFLLVLVLVHFALELCHQM